MPTGYKKSDGTDIEDGLAPAVHNHDSEYYTEAELDTLLSGKADPTDVINDSLALDGLSAASFLLTSAHSDYSNHSAHTNYSQTHPNYVQYSNHSNYSNSACY